MNGAPRGRLLSPTSAPRRGEHSAEIGRIGGVVIEQILSGRLAAPLSYDQAHDEWVLLLSGRAVLELAGERLDLTMGDWVQLPAHVPHRLLETQPGTTWLALHDRGPNRP
jgi:cupin 2 domain-containing protein